MSYYEEESITPKSLKEFFKKKDLHEEAVRVLEEQIKELKQSISKNSIFKRARDFVYGYDVETFILTDDNKSLEIHGVKTYSDGDRDNDFLRILISDFLKYENRSDYENALEVKQKAEKLKKKKVSEKQKAENEYKTFLKLKNKYEKPK